MQFRSWGAPIAAKIDSPVVTVGTRVEYVLDLSSGAEEAAKKFRTSARRKLRRASDNKLEFYEDSSPELTRSLIKLLKETQAIRKGRGLSDYEYFYMPFVNADVIERLLREGMAKITWVQKDKKILSAFLLIIDARNAYYLIGGTNKEGYNLNANTYMVAEQIKWLSESGIDELNLGGVPKNTAAAGLHQFKTSMGAEPRDCVNGDTKFLQGHALGLISYLVSRLRGWSYSFQS
jgi:lipid II:glycine glycyltransferase (peptidoglycan interpeptide bridge formation enzyme)